MNLDESIEKFLRSNDHCRLATVERRGSSSSPHCVPIGYCYNEGKVYLATNSKSAKVRNLLSEPSACILVDTYENKTGRGVMLQGIAQVVTGDKYHKLKPTLESFSGWHLDKWELGQPPNNRVDAIIEFEPRKVVVIGRSL